jgi:hypothetical protein
MPDITMIIGEDRTTCVFDNWEDDHGYVIEAITTQAAFRTFTVTG